MIKDHEFKPGDKLPSENYFTELFGVSRTPIREALSILEASGLITSKQGGGSVIQSISVSNLMEETSFEFIHPQEVVHLLETRMITEAGAAYFAAKRRTQTDADTMHKALLLIRDSQLEEKIGHQEDIHFHKVIVKASHNPVLIQTMKGLSTLYDKAVKYSLSKNFGWEEKKDQVFQEHEEIYQAIERQDPESAQRAMINHLGNAKMKLVQDLPD
ncbi:GntR family transcriptional repressor for pyruvate dehydrogenase complex [Geomicrobium halophilum]|uniref:GntR family transcriptional repressor for pyruvate dehydrogenase complex n=2 Tax=Geomicrobium halophilum TaxID=549000 RepID=A0A841PMF4_9BACL|nr:GntR family transcriptional repressor for pyruvate dehydrogenase complex [Geomicrobium halophilum]